VIFLRLNDGTLIRTTDLRIDTVATLKGHNYAPPGQERRVAAHSKRIRRELRQRAEAGALIFFLLLSSAFAQSEVIHGFNSGELSPLLDARTDLSRHYSACRTLSNFLAEPWGDVTKRPGTYYITVTDAGNGVAATTTSTSSVTNYGMVSAQDGYIVWYDMDLALLEADSAVNDLCSSLAVCSDGSVVATSSPNGLMKFDSDRTLQASFFSPSGSWPGAPYYVQAVRATPESDYIYACYNGTNPDRGGVWKFNNSTGDEEWVTLGSDLSGTIYIDSQGLAVDSASSVYFSAIITGTGYGVIILDASGTQSNTTEYVHNMSSVRDIAIDETLGQIFIAGGIKLASPYHQLAAYNLDGTNELTFSIGNTQSNIISCVLTDGTYIYCSGTQTASGVGGADATVWKLDNTLTLQASYDTGNWARYMCWDPNGNIIVKQETTPAGGDNYIVLDTDLAHIETIAYADYGDYGWAEIQWWDEIVVTVTDVAAVPDDWATQTDPQARRLIAFEPYREVPYVIEMGHKYMRFLK
jgi:hypothetical protein